MNNREVLEAVRQFRSGANRISTEMDDYIKANYTKVADEYKGGTWYKVYRSGSDPKYGHYMIEPRLMMRRSSTISEFYGGGVVD